MELHYEAYAVTLVPLFPIANNSATTLAFSTENHLQYQKCFKSCSDI